MYNIYIQNLKRMPQKGKLEVMYIILSNSDICNMGFDKRVCNFKFLNIKVLGCKWMDFLRDCTTMYYW